MNNIKSILPHTASFINYKYKLNIKNMNNIKSILPHTASFINYKYKLNINDLYLIYKILKPNINDKKINTLLTQNNIGVLYKHNFLNIVAISQDFKILGEIYEFDDNRDKYRQSRTDLLIQAININ